MESSINSTVSGGSGPEDLYRHTDPNLLTVTTWYWHVHPYVSLVVCTFGIITNIFNIVILNLKKLRSPINCILSVIALSDVCLMVCYLPFVIHFYILTDIKPTAERYSLGWMTFLKFHVNFTAVLHTASMWLAVYLAAFRYFFLKVKSSRTTCFQIRSTCIGIVAIFVLSTLILVPNVLMTQTEEHVMASNESLFRLKDLGVGSPNQGPLVLSTFWMYASVGKIIPSIVIITVGGLLLKTLSTVKRLSISLNSSHGCRRATRHNRTPLMLIIITVLYAIAELPQGIMILLCCYAEGFFQNVYMPLGDIMDIIVLIINAVNFILYCCMSQQFRELFLQMISIYGAKNKGYTQELQVITNPGLRTQAIGMRHRDCVYSPVEEKAV